MAFTRKKKGKHYRKIAPILNSRSDFSAIEAYRTIRTNLMFATQNAGGKRIIITSTVPNEGKSTNCCNLGITLAQTKSRVLIIDCDLRKPAMHKFFKLKGIPGLSEVLAGMNMLSEVVQSTEYPNLHIICGGTVPPNPAELLGSRAMSDILDVLATEYDYILFDTPPVNVVSDALVLSPVVDGIVLIVRQGETRHPDLNHAISSIQFAHTKILGIILNGVDVGKRYGNSKYGYGRKHYRNYQDYYGEKTD